MKNELKYMLIAHVPENIEDKYINGACKIVKAEYDKHIHIPRIFRFIANEEDDLKFLISRLKLKPL